MNVNGDYNFGVSNRGGKVFIGGGKIVSNGSYALDNSGTLALNTTFNEDGTITGNGNKVYIKGGIRQYNNGKLAIALDKYGSKMHGVVYQEGNGAGGGVSMILKDGAEWINEKTWNDESFTGSVIKNFVGGKSNADRGSIIQKDGHTLRFEKYSGNTIVHYDRGTGIGTETSHFIGGDTVIGSAAEGSVITLSTPKIPGDKNVSNIIGFDPDDGVMTSQITLNKILDNLAGKLVYEGALKGEKTLQAKVQIGSGMTASSATSQIKDITFDENGRGNYEYEIPYDFTQTITGVKNKDTQYAAAGVIDANGDYIFDGKKDVNLNGGVMIEPEESFKLDTKGKNLNINSSQDGIYLSKYSNGNDPRDLVINAGAVNVNVEAESSDVGGINFNETPAQSNLIINADKGLNIFVHSTGTTQSNATAYGINSEGMSNMTINGNVNIKGKDGNAWGVSTDNSMNFNYYQVAGLAAQEDFWGNGKAGKLTVNGNVDMAVKGCGILAYGRGTGKTEVTVNGDTTILIDKDLVSHNDSFGNKVYANMYSLVASDGTINVNVNEAKNGAANHTVKLSGNIGLLQARENYNTTINLGLSNAESSLTGIIYNTGNTKTDKKGTMNLYLSNGAIWNNEDFGHASTNDKFGNDRYGYMPKFNGSFVNNFVGGSSADKVGYIYQKDAKDITLDSYKGHTVLYYDHTGNGTEAGHYAAGNTIVNKAAAGSSITVSTNNKGINMEDLTEVNKVLNTLAGKLFYNGAIGGKENNLSATVNISSGLTSSAVSKYFSGINFDNVTGQGGTQGMEELPQIYPDTQQKTEFGTTITGDKKVDKEYLENGVLKNNGIYEFTEDVSKVVLDNGKGAINAAKDVTINATGKTLELSSTGAYTKVVAVNANDKNVTITADKVNVIAKNTTGEAVGIAQLNKNTDQKATTTIKGNVNIEAAGKGKAYGAAIDGNSELNINGNLTMKDAHGSWGVTSTDSKANEYEMYSVVGLKTGFNFYSKNAGVINVNGDVDLAVNGTGLLTNGGGEINVNGGGTILTNKDNVNEHYAAYAEGGKINMNMNADRDAAGTKTLKVYGNIGIKDNASYNGDTVVNVGLSTKDSAFKGVVVNKFAQDAGRNGEVNLYMSNGATWTNEVFGVSAKDFKGSHVNKLVGGKDAGSAAYVVQKDSNKITVDNYSGHMNFYYEHKNDGTNVADFEHLGDTVIKNAAKDSYITISTSSKDIKLNNKDSVEKVLNNLAGKLYYMNSKLDKNLTGKVMINSGLTGSAQEGHIGEMVFDDNHKGDYVEGSVKPEIVQGAYENEIMHGARSAMTDSMLNFRDIAADSFVRNSELRNGVEEGAWARVYGGESEFGRKDTSINNSYKAVQAGFDKAVGDWTLGVAVDYRDGDSDYMLGGEGENKTYSIGVYGTKELGNGAYIDLAAKAGKVENDYKVYNLGKDYIEGSYSAPGYSISAQYGKRVETGSSYFEPQMQFTWTHINSDSYQGTSNLGVMDIDQDAFDSLVGRIGVEAGMSSDKGNLFARLSLNHEFAGEVDTVYFADDGGRKMTNKDVSDTTWSEITVGGNYKLSKCSNFFADVTKALTGDYKQEWKVNAGLSFSF